MRKLKLSLVIKHIASGAAGLGSISGTAKTDTASPTATKFLRSCVDQMLSRGDDPPLVTRFGVIPPV